MPNERTGTTPRNVLHECQIRPVGGSIKRPSHKRMQTNRRALRFIREAFAALDDQGRADVREALAPFETLVLEQILVPNYEAGIYANAVQAWDEKTDDAKVGPVRVLIEFEDMAKGLQMDLVEFERIAARITTKLQSYIKTGMAVEHLDCAILRQLEAVFHLPRLPPYMDVEVVRQVLAVVARHQHQKVTARVATLLESIGVKHPQRAATLHHTSRGIGLDSTSIKVHPDGTGARKKTDRKPSADHGAVARPRFIWSPRLIGAP